jgi:hypothetical protein
MARIALNARTALGSELGSFSSRNMVNMVLLVLLPADRAQFIVIGEHGANSLSILGCACYESERSERSERRESPVCGRQDNLTGNKRCGT